jgi:hypothetical protein
VLGTGVVFAVLGTVGVGDGVVFVRYLLLMRLNFKSAAIFSDRTKERLTDELYIFSFFVYGVTTIAFLQRLCRNGILDMFQKRGLWFGP